MDTCDRVSLQLLTAVPGILQNSQLKYQEENECTSVLPKLRRRRIDSLYYIQLRNEHIVQSLYDRVWRLQEEHLVEFADALESRGLRCLTYKGASYIRSCLGGRPINMMHDVDLFVEQNDVVAAKKILRDLGYVQGDLDRDTLTVIPKDSNAVSAYEAGNYELYAHAKALSFEVSDRELACRNLWLQAPLWLSDDGATLTMNIDVHVAPSVDISSDIVWKGTENVSRHNLASVRPTVQLWLSMLRYYNEVALGRRQRNIREIAYMIAMVSEGEIDWQELSDLTATHDVRPAIYYSLCFIATIANLTIPSTTIAELDPLLGDRSRDFGWQYSKLFGLKDLLPYREMAEQVGEAANGGD